MSMQWLYLDKISFHFSALFWLWVGTTLVTHFGYCRTGHFHNTQAASLDRSPSAGRRACSPSSLVGLGWVYLIATFFPECVCITPFSDFRGRIGHLMSELCQTESVLIYNVDPLVSGPQGWTYRFDRQTLIVSPLNCIMSTPHGDWRGQWVSPTHRAL